MTPHAVVEFSWKLARDLATKGLKTKNGAYKQFWHSYKLHMI